MKSFPCVNCLDLINCFSLQLVEHETSPQFEVTDTEPIIDTNTNSSTKASRSKPNESCSIISKISPHCLSKINGTTLTYVYPKIAN